MRVLLVDDHPVILEIMPAVLRRALGRADVLVETTLESALEHVRRQKPIDLAVLDLGLPGCSGVSVVTGFRSAAPEIPLIVLSATDDTETIRAAFAAGVKGYIPKNLSVALMVSAIRLVRHGGSYVPSAVLDAPKAGDGASNPANMPLRKDALTNRQLAVLRGLANGKANRAIGRELDISENTVKQHVKDIFRLLGLANRLEAGIAAKRHGIALDDASLLQ